MSQRVCSQTPWGPACDKIIVKNDTKFEFALRFICKLYLKQYTLKMTQLAQLTYYNYDTKFITSSLEHSKEYA